MEIKSEYIEDIIKSCDNALNLLKNLTTPRTYRINVDKPDTSIKDIEEEEHSSNKFIYIIKHTLDQRSNEIIKKFTDYKNKKTTNLPKINRDNNSNNIMYVGSSVTGFKSRIKAHFNSTTESYYSLKLNQWFEGNVKIDVYEFSNEIDNKVIQILEDNFHYIYKPYFGKSGSNNR